MIHDASDLAQLYVEAADIAESVRQPLTTAHCLLALFTFENRAEVLLKDRGIDEDALLAVLEANAKESPEIQRALPHKARELAQRLGSPEADCLQLLIALTGMKESLAYTLLERCGIPVPQLRNTALSYYTGRMPRRLQNLGTPTRRPLEVSAPAASTVRSDVSAASFAAPLAPRPSVLEAGALPGEEEASPAFRPSRAASEFELAPDRFPWLAQLGRNLSRLAEQQRLDPVIGRDREIDEVIDILGKRRANNPILVGEPGVGKTAVAEGVAQRLFAQRSLGSAANRIVVELDVASLVAGTQLRGSFSEKLNGIKEEVRSAGGRIIVFIDEIHTLVGAGSTGEGPQDAANELKAALARGEFPCIGATTHDEFRKFIQGDPALERRFTAVLVDEPSVTATVAILKGVAERYAQHHRVSYSPEAIEAAAVLSARYLTDRCLPDKALAVLDQAGSRCRREGLDRVGQEEVARTVAKMAGLPEERLLLGDRERLLGLEEALAARVVGHSQAIARVASAVRRNSAGFHSHRPVGSFLFIGPPGVGKTELARALAEVLYGTADALVRVDMSEMSEPHSVARLVGAPPGYVGFGEAGQLTEPVRRRPSCVVLLDEVDKSHRDVTLLLLQVLEEGRLTDSRGRHIDFSNAVVILTANLGAEAFGRGGARMGFGAAEGPEATSGRALETAERLLPPELWNRIDEKISFPPLSRNEIGRIAELLLASSSARLQQERRIGYRVDAGVIDHLITQGGCDATLGARPLRQTIQRLIEGPLAEHILRGEFSTGDQVSVALDLGSVRFLRA